jgi:hypothetical protein
MTVWDGGRLERLLRGEGLQGLVRVLEIRLHMIQVWQKGNLAAKVLRVADRLIGRTGEVYRNEYPF